MKILLVNNFSCPKGGAEVSLLNTGKLLKEKKHHVYYFFADKELKKTKNNLKRVFKLLYSLEARKKISQKLDKTKPDIVHLNNIYHHLSPSIIDEVKRKKIPLVMTLHDYKLVCAIYKLWRNGKVCQECKNEKYISILKNKCNLKGNLAESFLLWMEMVLHHKILHIYEKVDLFISPSRFLVKQFRQMGFKNKIVYLPNFVFLNKRKQSQIKETKTIVYFGRLTPEKGLLTLIKAVKNLPIILKIIGDGNLKFKLEKLVLKEKINNVKFLGWLDQKKLKAEIKKSMFTILASEWPENNPRAIIESFALGKPVLASKIGGIPELVKDKKNGLLFEPGNIKELRNKIIWMITHRQKRKEMGGKTHFLIRKNYHQEIYYKKLINLYKSIL